jgi:hypothetical protein
MTDLVFATLSYPPQTAAAEMTVLPKSLVNDIGDCFFKIEDSITNIFLPALFGETLQTCNYCCKLAALPAKFAGLGIPNPSATSEDKHKASTFMCSYLLVALQGFKSFSLTEHQFIRTAITAELKVYRSVQLESTFNLVLGKLDCNTRITILQGKEMGQWLSIMLSMLNGTKLSMQVAMPGQVVTCHHTVMGVVQSSVSAMHLSAM